MKYDLEKVDIFVDELNLFSLIKIFIKCKNKQITRIYYDNYNLSKIFSFFLRDIKILNINRYPSGRIKIAGKVLFQYHWEKISDFLNFVYSSNKILNLSDSFLQKEKINRIKHQEHLKTISLAQIYCPIKLIIFGTKIANSKKYIYIFKHNPFKEFLENYFGINIYKYFNPFISKRKKYTKENLIHYLVYRYEYFSPKLEIFKKVIFFLKIIVFGLMQKKPKIKGKKICIELRQREINLNDITDFYWVKFYENKEDLITISYTDWDKQSKETLKELGIKNFSSKKLYISFNNFLKIFISLPKLFFNILFYNNFDNWLKFQNIFYLMNVNYYNSIFKAYNIKLFFSMSDWDDKKFVKAQAIENNDGVTIYSHWSNYQFLQKIYRKYSDILFTWSDSFKKNIFNYYKFSKIFSLGYPSDHYFDFFRREKENEKKNFIIGYMDNIFANDLQYDISHNNLICNMLIEVLDKYPNTILHLKPKSKELYSKYYNFKKLKKLIDDNRVKVFFGDNFNEKMNPAKFSSYCDLVLSLGVSTAGAEASFFGIKSFHYDTMNSQNENEFAIKGNKKAVFNNILELKSTIESEIKSSNTFINNEENKKIHGILDAYQDGKCGERTALIMKSIYELYEGRTKLKTLFDKVDNVISKNKKLFQKKYNN